MHAISKLVLIATICSIVITPNSHAQSALIDNDQTAMVISAGGFTFKPSPSSRHRTLLALGAGASVGGHYEVGISYVKDRKSNVTSTTLSAGLVSSRNRFGSSAGLTAFIETKESDFGLSLSINAKKTHSKAFHVLTTFDFSVLRVSQYSSYSGRPKETKMAVALGVSLGIGNGSKGLIVITPQVSKVMDEPIIFGATIGFMAIGNSKSDNQKL